MGMSEAYRDQLLALLPQGVVWPQHKTSVLSQVLYAFADEFARLDASINDLLKERSPLQSLALLDEWEQDYGLPEPCISPATSDVARRAAILAKILAVGGYTKAFFLQVLQGYDIDAQIEEFMPYDVDADVDTPIYDQDWIFAWMITLPADTLRVFTVLDGVDAPLAEMGNGFVECLIKRLVPAHVFTLFNYV